MMNLQQLKKHLDVLEVRKQCLLDIVEEVSREIQETKEQIDQMETFESIANLEL